jgi:DNA-binding MarR family transcriptional regulator
MGQIATLQRAVHLIGAHIEAALGMTQGEAHVLFALAQPGELPIVALRRELGLKPSTVTNILDRLEARGLLRRAINPDDRRSLVVHLTARGKREATAVATAYRSLEARLPDAQLQKLVEALVSQMHA